MGDSMSITPEQVEELAARATPGPWEWDDEVPINEMELDEWDLFFEEHAPWLVSDFGPILSREIRVTDANARFIATAPAMAALIADQASEIDWLKRKLAVYEGPRES